MPVRCLCAVLALAASPAVAGCAGVLEVDGDDDAPADDDSGDDDAADDDAGDDDVADDDSAGAPVDADGDGAAAGADCDDADPAVHPGAAEAADGADNDCDGVVDEGTVLFDDDGDGASEAAGDCDDADPEVHPGAGETPYDGVDQDCDGRDLTDVDADGFPGGGGPDCDDDDPTVHPGAAEVASDGLDANCDGIDGPPVGDTCLGDSNVLVVPGEVEYNLSGSDATGAPAPDGASYDDVEMELASGTTVLFQHRSIDFDPAFLVLSPTCEVIAASSDIQPGYDDDDRLEFTAPSTGVFTVVATTAAPGQTGDYVFTATTTGVPLGESCGYRSSTFAYGDLKNGSLTAADAHDGPGGPDVPLDDWEFDGSAGDAVTVVATSTSAALAVWLLDPDCAPRASATSAAAGEPATATATLAADGPHTVYVSTASAPGAPVAYQLELTLTPP